MKFTDKQEFEKANKFGTGAPNTAYAKFFIPAAYTGIQALFRLTNRKGDERICFDH